MFLRSCNAYFAQALSRGDVPATRYTLRRVGLISDVSTPEDLAALIISIIRRCRDPPGSAKYAFQRPGFAILYFMTYNDWLPMRLKR